MTTPHKALLQQALKALQNSIAIRNHEGGTTYGPSLEIPAIAALQAAIDAPDPEPEALRHSYDGYGWLYVDKGSGSNWKHLQYPDGEFLYTHPPAVREERKAC